MVLKPVRQRKNPAVFENDVKMYGTQTSCEKAHGGTEFENDVKMYGTQTACGSAIGSIEV